jgi:hypothetical protein
MAIPDYARKNFQTLLRAAEAGHLALMECTDAVTGEVRYVLCAVGWQDGEYVISPFGHVADGEVGSECRADFRRSVSQTPSPNRTCKFPSIRLSMHGLCRGWPSHRGEGVGCRPELPGPR